MEKSPAAATSHLELVLEEPCGLLILITILTWCISRIQSFHRASCQSCSQNPSNKQVTLASVLTDNEVFETRNKNKKDDMEVTYKDIETVTRSIGLNFDQESSEAIGSDYIHRIFDEDEPSLHEVRQAFLVFDENKDGYLDASDLQRVFQSLGLGGGVDLGECEKMVAKYDLNNDRRIDLVEFTKVLEASIC
jgi:calmodulin